MLARAADLSAELCRRHAIPAQWLWPPDLRAGKRGLTTHASVSEAFRRSTHYDPGPAFPVERFLGLVRAHLGVDGRVELLKPRRRRSVRGSTGWQVKRLQRLLRSHGQLGPPAQLDGEFGPVTEAAVRAFQALHGLEPDGIVGPLTWGALLGAT